MLFRKKWTFVTVKPKPTEIWTCAILFPSFHLVLLSHFGTSRWLHLEAGRMGKRGSSSTPSSNGKSLKVDHGPWVSKMVLILENLVHKPMVWSVLSTTIIKYMTPKLCAILLSQLSCPLKGISTRCEINIQWLGSWRNCSLVCMSPSCSGCSQWTQTVWYFHQASPCRTVRR